MEISPAQPSLFSNRLNYLNKDVLVEAEGLTVYGRLVRYQLSSKAPEHKLNTLIMETPLGYVIIRGDWTAVKHGIGEC